MGAISEVKVPDIGGSKDVSVIEVLVTPGQTITKEQSLITLETDKASMEVPSPMAGVVKDVKLKVGDKVSEGSLILTMEAAGAVAAPAAPAPTAAPAAPAAAAPVAAATPTSIEVRVPDIGDTKGVKIIEMLVSVGQTVTKEQSLITLESDKASMEVPSPAAGTIKSIAVKLGDKVSEGDLILTLDGVAAAPVATSAPAAAAPVAAPAAPKPAAPAAAAPVSAPVASGPIDDAGFRKAHASPSVRLFARELGVDLGKVTGNGPKGRITPDDVKAFVKAALSKPAGSVSGGSGIPAMPDIDFSKFGEIEIKPLSRINKLTGANLHRAWLNVPAVTQFDQADITDMEAFRKENSAAAEKKGVKLTPLAFLLKASASALLAFPRFNSSLEPSGENLILKKYVNIGIAVDTPDGLVVPVIRDVDKKGLFEIAKELGEISAKARDKKLKATDMQGACFTISSLGGIGGTAFTPIVNAPEVAILGVSKSSMQPVYKDGGFVPRLMLPLSLSYDHRVIDGAEGARFTTYLSAVLGDLRKLLL